MRLPAKEEVMKRRYLVMASAWLEIVTGAVLIMAPDVPCRLLFEVGLEGAGVFAGRLAGIGLLALGIACRPSTEGLSRSAVLGLFAYNFGTAMLASWVGLATSFRGILLWPAAVLHAVIAAVLLAMLLSKGSLLPKPEQFTFEPTA